MRMRSCLTLAAFLGTALLAVGADEEEPLYPLKLQSKWTYKVNKQERNFVITAAAADAVGDEKCVKLEARLEDEQNIKAAEHVGIRADGVYRYKFNEQLIEQIDPARPGLCFLKRPAKKGEKWDVKFKTGGKEGTAKFEQDEEEVEVAAGKYKAVVVRAVVVENEAKITTTCWYARDVGMVKQVIDVGGQQTVLELVKFEIGKTEAKDAK